MQRLASLGRQPFKHPCGKVCPGRCNIVKPTYRKCKQIRLCDLVDPGLLLTTRLKCDTLKEYQRAHDQLLRGASELAQNNDDLAASEHKFVEQVRSAHRSLFRHVLPEIAGVLRTGAVSFGGDGRNGRDGVAPAMIVDGLKRAFQLSQNKDWGPARRSAAFLAHFFRVHPFEDGNGRVGRFMVQKICRQSNKQIPAWSTSGKERRQYVAALEYAHRHYDEPNRHVASLRYLEKWILKQMHDLNVGDLEVC